MNLRAHHLKLGADAESDAARYLIKQGLKLKTRNYRSRWGEIDIIMNDGDVLVFVEVRYRSRNDFGSAAETIDHRKQQRIARTAFCYNQENNLHDDVAMRFDVVLIENYDKHASHNNAKIDWIKNAFDACLD
ncbi:MAG: YraN family protein [Gammaproteobacteria bacterium]|nr:MAG: YraN family protein [Gammaproteobacteria bacterium]